MTDTLRQTLADGVVVLRAAGVENAARDARLLLADCLDLAPERLILVPERPLSALEQARFKQAIAERKAGKPVSRILGRRAFWGRDFCISDGVLDPRPETETLIAAALELTPPACLLDLGCGSGIIAVTLLAEWGDSRAVASDVEARCLAVTRQNAAAHGVEARLSCVQSDWFGEIEGRFGLIAANPPYITSAEMATLAREVVEHDPHLALSPGGDGLAAYRTICAHAAQFLASGGHLLLEIGPCQGAAVSALMTAGGLADVRIRTDLDGRDRLVQGRKPA